MIAPHKLPLSGKRCLHGQGDHVMVHYCARAAVAYVESILDLVPVIRVLIDKVRPKFLPHQKVDPHHLHCTSLRQILPDMPPYESDSSDEGEEYTETNVLLGYASEEPSGDTVSHLGGRPVCVPHHICGDATDGFQI